MTTLLLFAQALSYRASDYLPNDQFACFLLGAGVSVAAGGILRKWGWL